MKLDHLLIIVEHTMYAVKLVNMLPEHFSSSPLIRQFLVRCKTSSKTRKQNEGYSLESLNHLQKQLASLFSLKT